MLQAGLNGLSRMDRLAQRFRAFTPHTIALLLWSALGFACLAFFFHLAFSIHPGSGAIQSLDDRALRYIGAHLRTQDWDFFFVDLSSLGSMAVVTAICVISMVLFVLSRDPAAAIHLLIVAVGGFRISSWAKTVIDRPRPDIIPKLIQVGGKSFPSGHAVTAAAIYLTLAILACRHFKSHAARVSLFGLAALMIGAVAFSRMYVGVHYPSDVLSGALLGSAWAMFMGAIFSKKHFFEGRYNNHLK
jgi:undecaprenyl-diphosphatase